MALGRAWLENRAEGEAAQQPVAFHLDASMFRLPKQAAEIVSSVNGPTPITAIDPQERVRVLLLVEAAE